MTASPAGKWEIPERRVESQRVDTQDYGRCEWEDKFLDTQGNHRDDRLDNNPIGRGRESKWDLEKDVHWEQKRIDGRQKRDFVKRDSRQIIDKSCEGKGVEGKWELQKDLQLEQEKADGRRKRDFGRQDSRQDADTRRDIDKSWRRPLENSATNVGVQALGSATSPLVDPLPNRTSRLYSYNPIASAIELAQAFSRSSSITLMTSRGMHCLRSPLSPLHKDSIQSFMPGYKDDAGGPNLIRDSPFSRLAEASMPRYSPTSTETQRTGVGYGLQS